MPLDKAQLKTGIIALLEPLFANTNLSPAEAREAFADGLANKIDEFVKTGLVTVTTNGSATTQTGTGNIT